MQMKGEQISISVSYLDNFKIRAEKLLLLSQMFLSRSIYLNVRHVANLIKHLPS